MKKQLLTLVVGLGGILSASAIDWSETENLAAGATVTMSSIREGKPLDITDENDGSSCSTFKTPYSFNLTDEENPENNYEVVFEEPNWFLFDLGDIKEFSYIEIKWRDNHAYSYDIYVSENPFEFSPLLDKNDNVILQGGYPLNQLKSSLSPDLYVITGGNGNPEDQTANLIETLNFEARKGQYILLKCSPNNHALNWGCGMYTFKVAHINDDEELTAFNVKPSFVELNQPTELTFSVKNQHGAEMAQDAYNLTVSDNAILNGNLLTIQSGNFTTVTAKDVNEDISIESIIYVPLSPSVPTSFVEAPIYTNGIYQKNETAGFETAYNGSAKYIKEYQFEDGTVASRFDDIRCVFLYNTATTGAWNGNLMPIEKGWNEFHISVFPSSDVNGYIDFEGVDGIVPDLVNNRLVNFSLQAGQWNDVIINVSGASKLNNLSIRFDEANMCDVLLTNIYFTGLPATVLNIGSIDALEWSPEGMQVKQYVSATGDLDIADCNVKVALAPKGFDKIENFNIETSGLPSWQIAQWKYINETNRKVDGFLVTDPQAEIDSDKNLNITTDCSGLYELTISSGDPEVSFQVDGGSIYKEYKQDLIIYPSLGLVYEYIGENGIEYNDGINLNDFQVREGSAEAEGGNYNNSEENLAKLSEAFLIIPGVYNVKIYYNVNNLVENSSLSRKKAPVAHAENGLPEGYENYKEATGMYGNVLDLSDIASAQSGTVHLVLAKNGVVTPLDSDDPTGQSSMTHFEVVPGTGGVVTSVGEIVTENVEAVTEYFTLNGIKVKADNLTKGIYIVKKGNKTSKIIL